ncbi:MAG TPA: alpha amylase C-terminal domain-containing protein, partial [Rhodocyclaceae bacterium]|nr:alpha amylase C-terminal domain-containing protein [Rhodocyclaceae bacterium]
DLDLRQDLLLHWAGLDGGDQQMTDDLRFTRELIHLRWKFPGLRGNGFRVVHIHDHNRVLVFHRWVEGVGHDVIVVVHLAHFDRRGYRIGFPGGGSWREIFNSDVFEVCADPNLVGNRGEIRADPWPLHDFAYSAEIALPANSIVVFAR